MEHYIQVRGARQHNLKNISLAIPKDKLVVFTGVSGSGKSSLAFDTIYAEGQRRYVESLSSYARQFLGIMDKPDIDSIDGLSPAISIDQKSTSHNPRSTVGTVTEIYDYLRLLFARIGHPHCPNCGKEIARQNPQQIVEQVFATLYASRSQKRFMVLSPVVRDRKGEFSGLFDNLKAKGYSRIRIDGKLFALAEGVVLIKTNKHSIDVVVDKFSVDNRMLKDEVALSNLKTRLTDSVEQATQLSDGLVIISQILDSSFEFPANPTQFEDHLFSERFACPVCNISIPEIEPRTFSFNSPHGACPKCTGLGIVQKIDETQLLNPSLSILEGGILPFAKIFFYDTWFSRILKHVAEAENIKLRVPISSLTQKEIQILLSGTGNKMYTISGTNRFGEQTQIHEHFRGIVGELERRYQETDSDTVRNEIEKFMHRQTCQECNGTRLKPGALAITLNAKSIADVTALSINEAIAWLSKQSHMLQGREDIIATPILKEIITRLTFLQSVGLDYLSLARTAGTLSGGEAQRIRLASQVGSGLTGVLYVLDEPSIGLHQKDNERLIQTLISLKNLGNTVLVVEHDRDLMHAADYIFDFGPQAGAGGGEIIFSGTIEQLLSDTNSKTGAYLRNVNKIKAHLPSNTSQRKITLHKASENNLKHITVDFPLGTLICVTGVSGSGKSTLIVETLYHALARAYNPYHREKPGAFEQISGTEHIDKVILVDQSPIGRTPRSNPATYTQLFTHIRDLFSQLPDAKIRGYKAGRFSFNVKGGRCEACQGEGQIKIEMQFLSDVYVQCEVCHGKRFNSETLEVDYKGKNIAQVLDMTIQEASEFFKPVPIIYDKVKTLVEVGLGYMRLGQPATTLSGGEAQRVKLAAELAKRQTGKTVYILDEPTTGLHFADLEKLLEVLSQLVAKGNTVIVIEHNLDIIKNAQHIIDLGPDGGEAGGFLVASGTPQEVARIPESYTGQFLQKIM